jgi:hypothetical protein
MRKFGAALLACSAILVLAGPAGAQMPLERHFHSLETANEKSHVIAGGLTQNAPCAAFATFHENVHLGVFVFGNHPHSITAQGTGVFCP